MNHLISQTKHTLSVAPLVTGETTTEEGRQRIDGKRIGCAGFYLE